jgi:superoxide reductase
LKELKKEVRQVAEEGKTYVCSLCGQEVSVLKSGAGTLVCCDQPMEKKE